MSETGIEGLAEPVDRTSRHDHVRLLYVGRVVRTKGARDAIRAMSFLQDLKVTLDVVGDGVDRPACELTASDLGVADRVIFHGWKSKEQVADFYRAADIFVFPSYREPGGNVAFEAMASGLPLIVSDRGGPGSAVDDTCGIRVPPITPSQYAREIAGAIRRLVEDRRLRLSLGDGALRRVADTALWDRKSDCIGFLFAEVLRETAKDSLAKTRV
jgi:glycosyltransferase involved in cell wall biosynthesis